MPPRGANKEQILEAGMGLIYAQGYNATGIQDIANAAGVPKGSFYNYFKSKEDFAVEVISHYADETETFLKTHLRTGNVTPLNRMKIMLNRWADNMFSDFNGCGCLMGNITQEMSNNSEKIQKATARDFKRLEAQFVACLQDAQEANELASHIDVQKLGAFIYNGWQGALIRCKSEGNGAQLKNYVAYVFDDVLPIYAMTGEAN